MLLVARKLAHTSTVLSAALPAAAAVLSVVSAARYARLPYRRSWTLVTEVARNQSCSVGCHAARTDHAADPS